MYGKISTILFVCLLTIGCGRAVSRQLQSEYPLLTHVHEAPQPREHVRNDVEMHPGHNHAHNFKTTKPARVTIEKELAYDQHTLDDTYPYKDGTREFQWDKISDSLVVIETGMSHHNEWVVLQNYKNQNGVAPEVDYPTKDEYNSIVDEFGVSRYQSIPLYSQSDLKTPARYARDGSLVAYLADSADYVKVCSATYDGDWYVPEKYVKRLDAQRFDHAIFVDRTNQNITTLEKEGDKWLVRSMNPCTTGLHNPPYAHETPLGTFVIQEKREKMFYTGDGSSRIAGFAPWASRFTMGGFLHSVPVNNPNATPAQYIEISSTIGTTPHSHMCVRNATSHAKFIYDWAPTLASLVVVIE